MKNIYLKLNKNTLFIFLILTSMTLSFSVRGQNIALHKPATASSEDSSGLYPATNAVDGDLSTRWASAWSDPQWISIDLQGNFNITQVVLYWETAAGKVYQIQVSSDNLNWTTIYSTQAGRGGTETLNVAGTGRYIRMYGTKRTTSYGYSLYEFHVYGTPATNIAVTGITVSPAMASIAATANVQLTATVSPTNASNKTVIWSTSNSSVATVNSSGLATGVAAGTATITATTQDGGFKASASITVTAGGDVTVILSSEYKPMSTSWWTADQPYSGFKLAQQTSLALTNQSQSSSLTTINVNPSTTYQTIHGFGSSLEESTVYNLLLMDQTTRTAALKRLIDPVNGSGFNLWRLTIGTSDFTGTPWYSYDDMPAGQTDTNLTQFSIQNDINYGIIQVVKEALAINPNIKFFASPWSPPAWMKTSQNLCGGTLSNGMHQILAQYYRKFVQAYAAQGIPIYAMTIQNEPLQNSTAYPTMALSTDQEIALTTAIKSEFQANNITTKVWVYDHNFDNVSYPMTILSNANAYAAADGSAFHDYSGSPASMTNLHNAFPNKEIFFTERSAWGVSGMDRIAQYIRNWAGSYCAWVTMLDQNQGPAKTPFGVDPTFLIKGTGTANQYWNIPEVYLLGQYAKYVQYGAKRIDSDYGVAGKLTDVAFQNPDGSIVLVVMNMSASSQKFRVLCGGKEFDPQLPAKTVGTYIWKTGSANIASATSLSTNDETLIPALALPRVLPNGRFQMALSGDANSPYTIQSSTNLINWTPLLTTNVPTASLLYLEFPISGRQTFYRAIK